MLKKAEAGEYRSLEEFILDCDTLIHSVAVYFGSPSAVGKQRYNEELNKLFIFSQQVFLDVQVTSEIGTLTAFFECSTMEIVAVQM